MVHLLWIIPLALLIVYLSSPRFRGDIAEARVRRILASGLEKKRYTVLNDVTIPDGGGTVHIDHIVVSRSGIFVIDSLYVHGTVTGREFQDRWKMTRWGRVTRIDNPLHRNAGQVEAVRRLLDFPSRCLHSAVVMAGQTGFGESMPEKVVTPEKLIAWLRRKAQPVLESEQADRALRQIEEARIRPAVAVISRWRMLQIVLVVLLLAGLYLAFHDEFASLRSYHAERAPQTETVPRDDSLVCAYSADTGRCACYERAGPKVEIDPETCRSIAERGSVLKQ